MALSLDKTDLILCGEPSPRLTMDDIRLAIDRKSLGAVRISVGLVSNFEDVYQLVVFANRLCRGESAE
jgi:selenocysteine lyase/cysteine desulfurase